MTVPLNSSKGSNKQPEGWLQQIDLLSLGIGVVLGLVIAIPTVRLVLLRSHEAATLVYPQDIGDTNGTLKPVLDDAAISELLRVVRSINNAPAVSIPDEIQSTHDSTEEARLALARAEQLRADDPELASILYLNAFNSNPTQVEALVAYLDLVAHDAAPPEALQQAAALLDVALYKVPANTVAELLARKRSLEQRMLNANPVGAPPDEDLDKKVAAELLLKKNEELLNDPVALAEFLDSAERALEVMPTDLEDDHARARRDTLLTKVDLLQRSQEVVDSLDRVELLTRRATEFADNSNARMAMLLLNAAENGFVQAAALCDAAMPSLVLERMHRMQGELDTLSSRIGDLHAAAAMQELRTAANKAGQIASSATQPFEAHCKAVEEVIRQVQPSLARTSDGTRKEAEELLSTMQGALVELRRKQHIEYNRWVLQKCQNALDNIKDDAARVFANNALVAVDEKLLSPETARLYSEVIQKLMNKMSAAHVADHQRMLTLMPKRRLEEF